MSGDLFLASLVIDATLLTSADTADGIPPIEESHGFGVLSLSILDDEAVTGVISIHRERTPRVSS